MRLKRLELFGFKSFAERMVLDFSSPVTGIVGPNGCGKSNVVDAVRWVLGETRPTSMRGGEMTDVIFKGSASRPALSVAEVTLVLDNAENDLDGRGAEVSVTRRVYRSGEGEYLIDGGIVRLKDVREMLYGTGLGSRGYSVLEQGKIDAILSANALERRAIFEEAAGISRYRARKKETEARLERVQADCLRLDDVLTELERRRRSLKIQAGRAQRFVEARDAWQSEGKRLAQHQVHTLRSELAALDGALAAAEQEGEELRAQRSAAEQEISMRGGEQQSLQAGIERANADAAETSAELRGLDERRMQLGERAQAARRAAQEEGARSGELERRLTARLEEARVAEEHIRELEGATREAEARAQILAREVVTLEANLGTLAKSHEAQSSAVLKLLHARSTDQNQVQALERARGLLFERLARSSARGEELRAQLGGGRGEEASRANELEGLVGVLAGLEEERSGVLGEAQGLESQRSGLETRRNALEVEIARLSSRVEALRDWEEERAGLESGARELFRARERGEEPALSAELAGLFADHLHPDSRHARALDAALGLRAQAVVTRSTEAALAIVGWLRARSSGRVSLVLPESWSGALAERALPGALAAESGIFGRLHEFARPEPEFAPLAQALLGDALLVRDLASALELVARFPEWRFVTAEGDLVDAAGLSGGYQEVTHGPLGRRSTAAELDTQRARLEQELSALELELERLGQHQNEKAERLRVLGASLQRSLERRQRLASGLAALRARLEELGHALELAEAEQRERAQERGQLEAELEELRTRLAVGEEQLTRERAALVELEQARAAVEGERDQRARDEARARVEASSLVERLEAHRRERTQRTRAAEELRTELGRSQRLVTEHARSAEQGEAAAAALLLERDVLLERRGALDQELTVLRAREREARAALEQTRAGREELTQRLERALGALSERRLECQRLELAREEVVRRAREDFALALEELPTDFAAEAELAERAALETLGTRVRSLKESLDELGAVNLEAVSELKEVDERHGFLHGQRTDLEDSRKTLGDTLRRLNEESERMFLEAFEQIREHFKTLFRQLFGGGKADITLMEGASVLDAGIEIMARPPGREVLPISLLSGGQRTMTALAILFAVFRAQPSPFCILDEVDAALDDANIGRFLHLLEASVDGTQFIVVTHNKGTMAACQMLYGVTMAVRGVSHVVSVELAQVDEVIPAPRRDSALTSAPTEVTALQSDLVPSSS
ncbi:MAG: chromosome segregation protein SMC [Planctomycetes bacterium]|nr:chromosome segregation protein SMC [Planctomycetota bacterium]